ncbi:hypothetical protein ABVK25_010145 [Lepraria finkii]|uniref:Uncharacterized protein n=1 Tax=Lepraria finkii TaxID=1340010 RepID=A0ABR4AXM7_9LECA
MDRYDNGRTPSTPKHRSGHCNCSSKDGKTARVKGVASASPYQIRRTREWPGIMERDHDGKPFNGDWNEAQQPQRHRTIGASLVWRPSGSSCRPFETAFGLPSGFVGSATTSVIMEIRLNRSSMKEALLRRQIHLRETS